MFTDADTIGRQVSFGTRPVAGHRDDAIQIDRIAAQFVRLRDDPRLRLPEQDVTSLKKDSMALVFRCPKELEGLLPPPIPAAQGLPDWFKGMPARAFNPALAQEGDTVKRCPPFIDAMTSGFLMPLMCDLTVENGEFTWDNDLPPGGQSGFLRSPVGFHDGSQVTGTPLFEADRSLIKFHNLWTIEAPEGYSIMFTHPANRFDLPFTTLTGVVDCDRYHDAWIHFPAHWHDANFSGVLPKGTPIAQCIPVKRENWVAETAVSSDAETKQAHEVATAIRRETGVYRKQFRA